MATPVRLAVENTEAVANDRAESLTPKALMTRASAISRATLNPTEYTAPNTTSPSEIVPAMALNTVKPGTSKRTGMITTARATPAGRSWPTRIRNAPSKSRANHASGVSSETAPAPLSTGLGIEGRSVIVGYAPLAARARARSANWNR